MTGIECQNLFGIPDENLVMHKENQGFVRYINRNIGTFYLDPSNFLPTKNPDLYYAPSSRDTVLPPEGKLVRVVVTESKIFREEIGFNIQRTAIKDMQCRTIELRFIRDFEILNPDSILKKRDLSMEEYLDYLAAPIKNNFISEDLTYYLGMYTVASPKLNEIEQGGINVAVYGNFHTIDPWNKFKGITRIIPTEFRKTNSRNYYENLDVMYKPRSPKSSEVNLAYNNDLSMPIDIPLPFDVEFRASSEIKENQNLLFNRARVYLLEALLYTPEIPEKYIKNFEKTAYEVNEKFRFANNADFEERFGFSTRLVTSFARLSYNADVTKDNIKEAGEAYSDLMDQALKNRAGAKNFSGFHHDNPEEKTMMGEIILMKETGLPMTIRQLRAITVVPADKFEETLQRLKDKRRIYSPGNDRIGIVRED